MQISKLEKFLRVEHWEYKSTSKSSLPELEVERNLNLKMIENRRLFQ